MPTVVNLGREENKKRDSTLMSLFARSQNIGRGITEGDSEGYLIQPHSKLLKMELVFEH